MIEEMDKRSNELEERKEKISEEKANKGKDKRSIWEKLKMRFKKMASSSLFLFHESNWVRQLLLVVIYSTEHIVIVKKNYVKGDSDTEEEH